MKTKILLFILFSMIVQFAIAQSVTILPGNSTSGNIIPSLGTGALTTMFPSGFNNPNKMIIQHSPAFSNYGLQYKDVGDKFNFLSASSPVFTVDLGVNKVGVLNENPNFHLDVNGQVNASQYLINGSNYQFDSGWVTSPTSSVDTTVDGTCLRIRRLPFPQLTANIISGVDGTAILYFKVGSIGPYLLPYISDAGGATSQISWFQKQAGEIIVYRHTFNTCRFNSGIAEAYPNQPVMVNLPQTLEYRLVILKRN
jgi:hypothetical protein